MARMKEDGFKGCGGKADTTAEEGGFQPPMEFLYFAKNFRFAGSPRSGRVIVAQHGFGAGIRFLLSTL
jgi:hypothetical protein